ncbi:MAG: transcription antitermination factor NusB [Gammaproteobacteria bacterium]|nr:transcription antitermination factor NusB [Gammaproteobacteria bacterium]
MTGRTRNTRIALLQALLSSSVNSDDVDLEATKDWLRNAGYLQSIDKKRFNRWFADIPNRLEELDEAFKVFLNDRSLEELGQAEHTILRIATYELTYTDVPHPVTINEWIEIAKDYGAVNSFRFINGVLDKLATELRQTATNHE